MAMKKFLTSSILYIFLGGICFGSVSTAWAMDQWQPLAESDAYQEFLKKPKNNLSKMICILNYFRTAPVMVQYEGIDYTAPFAYPFGLVYLMTNYHDENPEQWTKKNCYRSLLGNTIIYFKFQDGSYHPARDVLIEKFHELEAIEKKQVPKA